jgi:hypothetical protein
MSVPDVVQGIHVYDTMRCFSTYSSRSILLLLIDE